MANKQAYAVNNKHQHLDYNSNNYNNNDNNNNNSATFQRLVLKFGDLIPKNMKNLQNISLEFPLDPLKPTTPTIYSLSDQIEFLNSTSILEEDEVTLNSHSLAQSIENALSEAKAQGIESGASEMLIPADLSSRVAEDIVKLAEDEPCGLKGCVIYINFEEKSCPSNNRRLGKVKCDSTSVPTFEVTLTLKQDCSWLRILPLKGCWKKLKSKAVVVSSNYSLIKNKLYRNNQQ